MGFYALVSYTVSQRAQEFAVRLAVGAQPRILLVMVLKQAMKLVLAGTILGSLAALAVSLWIQAAFSETHPFDEIAFGGSAIMLAAAMLLASIIPAFRAARIDPIIHLKEQ
ncbi:MAG: FtsX-like permease family protein [Acidobacteria bacterium]|nr:FtsX-like permease family protein [Acidobacteriota bacterium]